MWIKPTIGEQRKILITLIEPPMLNLCKQCTALWSNLEGLDQLLSKHFASIPYCQLLYIIDKFGKQITSNVSTHIIDPKYREQDLSRRPYSVSLYPKRHFMLSSVYISQTNRRPCMSAVHPIISNEQQFLGFLVADFDISYLPLSTTPNNKTSEFWLQSNCLLQRYRPQQRIKKFDQQLNTIQTILYQLISEYGLFQYTLHYSTEQIALAKVDDPCRYRLYTVEQLLSADIFMDFSHHSYPADAEISLQQVQQVLERFSELRLVDGDFYLRSNSLNIINGIVELNFSYDGYQQYLPTDKFLNEDWSSWFGQMAVNAN
ncbi:hypothetical protein THII_0332 [Thioploca ingrica]|uniref:Uncharacterized protein n=1 Tax=Thioploca ingrica TaxID=40754 RepID=A0A090ACX5_9GAMM|nr:hypothetical protein THII_0332 [Thioploca ingrica]